MPGSLAIWRRLIRLFAQGGHAMTIEDDLVVDAIAIDPVTDMVVFGISDHLSWDEPHHFRALEQKIGAYLEFVRSGQLTGRMPESDGRAIAIELICQFEPTSEAAVFLSAAARQLKQDENIQFYYRVLRV